MGSYYRYFLRYMPDASMPDRRFAMGSYETFDAALMGLQFERDRFKRDFVDKKGSVVKINQDRWEVVKEIVYELEGIEF